MTTYSIYNQDSGVELGAYEGSTEEQALDAMARDAGYVDYADACKAMGRTVEDCRQELQITRA